MREVAHIMGMAVSIDIPECQNSAVFKAAFDRLREIDERFSTYKKTSELSKYQAGQIKSPSREMRLVFKACQAAQAETNGYFSAFFKSVFDPTGYVKGWSIAEGGKVIQSQGHNTFCIGAGGDILARSDSVKIWQIGLENPRNKKELITQISAKNVAVATSGNYQRGEHIINPKTGQPARELLSLSVIGPDIIKADVLATAAFAMGLRGLHFIESSQEYEALAVKKTGQILMTAGFANHIPGSSLKKSA